MTWEIAKRDSTTSERRRMARSGEAMEDGRFPIANIPDLKSAIKELSTAQNRSEALAHIKRRARALGRTDLVSDIGKVAEWTVLIPIEKVDEHERLVFGWANVPHPVNKGDAPKVDLQDDQIFLSELEHAVYEYVEFLGEGDEMHTETVKAQLVESMVFTPEKLEKMGITEWDGNYGWWTGYRVDADVFAKVLDGTYKMLSIGGSAQPVEV